MPRPIWKGFITFGLVNIPVVLYSAENKKDLQFKLLDSRDQSRVKYVRVNEQTGEEVPWTDIAKGYEYDANNYVLLSEDELKEIAGEHSKTITIEAFVNDKNINCMAFDKPYYLVPDKKGEKGYVILREVLKSEKKVGIAKVVIRNREYLSALLPVENALVLNLLYYDAEIKKPSEFDLPTAPLKSYNVSTKELEVAKQLVQSMTEKWQPEKYHDKYHDALKEVIEDKIHHIKPHKKKETKTRATNVVNFVDLLKKSLKDKKKEPAKKNKKRVS